MIFLGSCSLEYRVFNVFITSFLSRRNYRFLSRIRYTLYVIYRLHLIFLICNYQTLYWTQCWNDLKCNGDNCKVVGDWSQKRKTWRPMWYLRLFLQTDPRYPHISRYCQGLSIFFPLNLLTSSCVSHISLEFVGRPEAGFIISYTKIKLQFTLLFIVKKGHVLLYAHPKLITNGTFSLIS